MPYLVDGNNLLGSWGGPRPGGEDRRSEVVRRVAELCRRRRMRATIVFDGAPLRPDRSAQELGLVSVRVPPPGGDADGVIREIIDRSPHPRASAAHGKGAAAPALPWAARAGKVTTGDF